MRSSLPALVEIGSGIKRKGKLGKNCLDVYKIWVTRYTRLIYAKDKRMSISFEPGENLKLVFSLN